MNASNLFIWGSAEARWLGVLATLLVYLALCGAIWRRARLADATAVRMAAQLTPSVEGKAPWIVAFASQTGSAEALAWQTAQALHRAGLSAQVCPLSALAADRLPSAGNALFIVSTYGEGDPPDNAEAFARTMDEPGAADSLGGLRYAVLALGDREYQHFAGFGRSLDAWLAARGAHPLFARIDVDNHDPQALQAWREALERLGLADDAADWSGPVFERWELVDRRLLNPGSQGAPTYEVRLQPLHGDSAWASGDLAQVQAPGDPDRPRDYSIASIPGEGALRLLVREERHADGRLGVASGWLTHDAALGAEVSLRVRAHKNFQLGANEERPLILIGNGTGLAGLRGHIKSRAEAIAAHGLKARHWLLFGERSRAHDLYWGDELLAWERTGVIEHLDLAFSRDGEHKVYVQDLLRRHGVRLRQWLAEGAAIYVCGSLDGMAGGVHAALVDLVGQDTIDALTAQGRYRRDVY